MKSPRYVLAMIVGFAFVLDSQAQPLSQEKRDAIIARLSDTSFVNRSGALRSIIKYNIVEALPAMESKFPTEPSLCVRMVYLRAFEHLASTNLHAFALMLLDSADVIASRPGFGCEPTEAKANAAYYLFKLGDNSGVPYLFDALHDSSFHAVDFLWLEMLRGVAAQLPQYAVQAKTEMIRISHDDPLRWTRMSALRYLGELYSTELFPDLLISATSDSDAGNRMYAMTLLFKLNYPAMSSLLAERLVGESSQVLHIEFADSLLRRYGSPPDYRVVLEFLPQETDTVAQYFIERALVDFVPPRANAASSVSAMLDSLRTELQQLLAYNWVGNDSFVSELDSHLQLAQSYLSSGDSGRSNAEVRFFQRSVETEHRDSTLGFNRFVTTNGWKYLCYNAQYILDRLSKPR